MIKLKDMTREQLLKIVRKLPRTKDGMPVVPDHDHVYHPDLVIPNSNRLVPLNYSDYNHLWVCPHTDSSRDTRECYSSEKLALDARNKQKK